MTGEGTSRLKRTWRGSNKGKIPIDVRGQPVEDNWCGKTLRKHEL